MTFKGQSRSSEMSWFDRAHMTSYYRSIDGFIFIFTLDIGQKSLNLSTASVFNAPVGMTPSEFRKDV